MSSLRHYWILFKFYFLNYCFVMYLLELCLRDEKISPQKNPKIKSCFVGTNLQVKWMSQFCHITHLFQDYGSRVIIFYVSSWVACIRSESFKTQSPVEDFNFKTFSYISTDSPRSMSVSIFTFSPIYLRCGIGLQEPSYWSNGAIFPIYCRPELL